MLSFLAFLTEQPIYSSSDYASRTTYANQEHDETLHQSNALKNNEMQVSHPAIATAIHHFAGNKKSFVNAVRTSPIQRLKKGTRVDNSEIGQSSRHIEDRKKVARVQQQIGKGQIERPIILRHKEENGTTHHHLLAGNTRATLSGGGQVHVIDV